MGRSPHCCSVVVPSYQRAERLPPLLDALASQTAVASISQIIVVLDGSTDDSSAVVARWTAAHGDVTVEVVTQPHRGAAAARNAGAERASAGVVLFLDDDVVPRPDLVAVHLAHHHGGASGAIVGDCPMRLQTGASWNDIRDWGWWVDFYHERSSGRRPTSYRDLCAANLSMPLALFRDLGGFDERFAGYGNEDWELGQRLVAAGIEILVEPRAIAEHHRTHSTADLLRHRRQEGASDIRFGTLHPEVRAGLRVALPLEGGWHRLARLAYERPRTAEGLIALRRREADVAARIGEVGRWNFALYQATGLSYWRGTQEVLETWDALMRWRASAPPPPVALLDVSKPVASPVALPYEVPGELQVVFGAERIGVLTLPALASREPQEVARLVVDRLGPAVALAGRRRNWPPPVEHLPPA